jgi:hypothetical protein
MGGVGGGRPSVQPKSMATGPASGSTTGSGRRGTGGGVDDRGGRAAERREVVQDRLELLDRAEVQLQEVAVLAGDPVALGDLGQLAGDLGDQLEVARGWADPDDRADGVAEGARLHLGVDAEGAAVDEPAQPFGHRRGDAGRCRGGDAGRPGRRLAGADAPVLLLAGVGVGLCSSVIPCVTDQLAMARLPRASSPPARTWPASSWKAGPSWPRQR